MKSEAKAMEFMYTVIHELCTCKVAWERLFDEDVGEVHCPGCDSEINISERGGGNSETPNYWIAACPNGCFQGRIEQRRVLDAMASASDYSRRNANA